MNREYYTYIHYRNDTNKPFYIGKGINARVRRPRNNRWWKHIVDAHGYTYEILAYWDTEKEAFEHEKFLIKCFRDMGYELVNTSDGGEGASGYRHTEEGKKKIAEAGRGRVFSEERKQKISAALTGNKNGIGPRSKERSPEHSEKISKALTGRKLSEEHKKNVRLGMERHRQRKEKK